MSIYVYQGLSQSIQSKASSNCVQYIVPFEEYNGYNGPNSNSDTTIAPFKDSSNYNNYFTFAAKNTITTSDRTTMSFLNTSTTPDYIGIPLKFGSAIEIGIGEDRLQPTSVTFQ